MNWVFEKCDQCNIWKSIGTEDKPAIFAYLWGFEDGQKVCPACQPPEPYFNTVGYTMQHMPMVRLDSPGLFVGVSV